MFGKLLKLLLHETQQQSDRVAEEGLPAATRLKQKHIHQLPFLPRQPCPGFQLWGLAGCGLLVGWCWLLLKYVAVCDSTCHTVYSIATLAQAQGAGTNL